MDDNEENIFTVKECDFEPFDPPDDWKVGLSFDRALLVNSIEQEYLVINNAYPDYKIISQKIIQKGDQYFDVFELEDQTENVNFYFDISLFYKP